MGLTSPEAVTVCRSSGFTSNLTVVTSASSLRLANTLIIITSASTATAATAIMIFFFFVKAITCSLIGGLNFSKFFQSIDFARKLAGFETNLIRVTVTSKNRKQFHLKEQTADSRQQEREARARFPWTRLFPIV